MDVEDIADGLEIVASPGGFNAPSLTSMTAEQPLHIGTISGPSDGDAFGAGLDRISPAPPAPTSAGLERHVNRRHGRTRPAPWSHGRHAPCKVAALPPEARLAAGSGRDRPRAAAAMFDHDTDPIPLDELLIYDDGELIFDGSDPSTYIVCNTAEEIRRAFEAALGDLDGASR